MKTIRAGIMMAAFGFALVLALPAPDAFADMRGSTCAKREIVATGSSIIAEKLAKIDAEMAWELKAVSKYGPLWYSWWAAKNNRFRCRTKGQRTTCVARGAPCSLL